MRLILSSAISALICLVLFSGCSQKPPAYLGTVHLLMEEDYGLAANIGKTLSLPAQTESFLKYIGIMTVPGTDQSFDRARDRVLKINVKGNATVGNYTDYTDKIPRYTGAEVAVLVQLMRGDSVLYEKAFTGNDGGSQQITDDPRYKDPNNAPFAEALENAGYFAGLAVMTAELYGPDALIQAGKQNRTVYYKKGDGGQAQLVANGHLGAALKSISGEKFGIDFAQWETWWNTKGQKKK
jgi:hypothetical protein